MVIALNFGSTIMGALWIPAVTLATSGAVIAVSRRRGGDRVTIANRVLMVWLMGSVAAAAILTLQPGPHAFDGARPSILNPLARLDAQDAVANVMLYLPVGFFAVLLWRSKPRPIAWALGFALALSLTIEMAQWVLPIDRAATTHDVLFNTLGGFVGAVAGTLAIWTARRFEHPSPNSTSDG